MLFGKFGRSQRYPHHIVVLRSIVASAMTFAPYQPLVTGEAELSCRASVVVPARNEAESLGIVLDRLAEQTDETGRPLSVERYEVLLLLNNCTDDSITVARRASARHSALRLHVLECTLPEQQAHVGTARRMLMDTAWHRLHRCATTAAILSTDADTVVSKNWITENLRALARGADAVGGEIRWREGELAKLAPGVQLAYVRDQRYQTLLAAVEDRLDPRAEDPMPRHLHHFGASLACTPEVYARAGGLPVLRSLEDVALVHALRRVGARLRHEPRVKVYTSGRLQGRVEVGLSGQLRTWQQMCARGEPHIVESTAWTIHRLRMSRLLRLFASDARSVPVTKFSQAWRPRLLALRNEGLSSAGFLDRLPGEQVIEQSFRGERFGKIVTVSRELQRLLDAGASAKQAKSMRSLASLNVSEAGATLVNKNI